MKKRLTRNQKRDKIQNLLEGYRRFGADYIYFGHNWFAPDEKFRYRQNAFNRFITFLIRTFLQIFAPILIFIAYGARVKGRENLKVLKKRGAICVCNHVSYLDTLFVRQAVGHYRSYHTIAPFNNKKGLGGGFIRHAGILPFSGNLKAVRNMETEMQRLISKGKIINFYAEKSLWVNYQKPRPMVNGAFYYAEKFDCPVLPVFCTFKKNKRGHMKKLVINILPPVYGDETLGKKQRVNDMRERTQNLWQECYEKAYGVPLEYLPDKRRNKN